MNMELWIIVVYLSSAVTEILIGEQNLLIPIWRQPLHKSQEKSRL
jgi:hypothetical protein